MRSPLCRCRRSDFDPCPPGWRVPLSGEGKLNPWSAFTADNGPWTGNDGRLWNSSAVSGGPAWYPTANERHRNNGALNYTSYGSVYSSSVNGTYCLYLFYSDVEVKIQGFSTGGYHRSYGHSVRCIRE